MWANIDEETLKVNYIYTDTVPMRTSDVPCSFPGDTVSDYATRDELGNIILTQDSQKIQKKNEKAWTQLRIERDSRLKSCDWIWSVGDLPSNILSTREDWASYRQALRDLPATVTDPTNVTWPTPPS